VRLVKSLIAVTGREEYILKKWLPSLRNAGQYQGDVLIVDYEGYTINLHFPNVICLRGNRVFKHIICDRFLVYYNFLRDNKYDVIMMTDGNDVEFLKPIQPLLDMAKDDFCYAKGAIKNKEIAWLFPDQISLLPTGYWNAIKKKPMINAGMIVGPYKKIMQVLKFLIENMSNEIQNDQMLLNVFIYCYNFPAKEVSWIWNYTYNHIVKFGCKDGEIAILHNNNLFHRIFFP
jgi:hypothetical protein